MENQACLMDKELEGLPWLDCSWRHTPRVGSQIKQILRILRILIQII